MDRADDRSRVDSFDRMLVAHAMIEDLTLATHDRRLRDDDIAILDA